jgi:hypothetical protein
MPMRVTIALHKRVSLCSRERQTVQSFGLRTHRVLRPSWGFCPPSRPFVPRGWLGGKGRGPLGGVSLFLPIPLFVIFRLLPIKEKQVYVY